MVTTRQAAGEEYEILVVRYGTRTTTRGDVYLNYGLYREADGPIGMDYFYWAARNRARTVVIDTGFISAGGAARGHTMLADPRDTLDELGIHPADEPTSAARVTSGHDPATFGLLGAADDARIATIGKLS